MSMKVLFGISEAFYSELLGIMMLSATLRRQGHQTLQFWSNSRSLAPTQSPS